MNNEISLLVVTAASLGFIHTVLGVDHYVPFIALSKSLNWTKIKTVIITALCGVGHVLSTVVIGIIGIALGLSISKLESIENARGEIAGWLLIAFGLAYTIYGIYKASKKHSHNHFHYDSGITHSHEHEHLSVEHKHLHDSPQKISSWTLFIIFVFGPCEALIPVLMIPAAHHSISGLVIVTLIFGVATILTMIVMVLLGLYGIELLPQKKLEKHIHTLAGITILICGIGVQFLGL
ncbi:MAG: sulfite exporter TauE/SafE family protein [Candidatus Anstonellales archaeon]